jgi:allantoin racemase
MRKILHVMPVKADKVRKANVKALLEKISFKDTLVSVLDFDNGPTDLEYYCSEHKAISLMLEEIPLKYSDYDAITIGCFYDPGLRELREKLNIPVLGIGETSMSVASTLGHRFSIIVGRKKWIPKMSDNALIYGYDRKIASWISADLTVEDFHNKSKKEIVEIITQKAEIAKNEDLAESIILGCAAIEGIDDILQERLKIPVINPVVVTFKVAETFADLKQKFGLNISKLYDYESKNC